MTESSTSPPSIAMRILIHDFGAYPFSVQLSRELASRGHEVHYVYFDESSSVRGDVAKRADDPTTFTVTGIGTDDTSRRSSFWRRLWHDCGYALHLIAEARSFSPELVVSADCPLVSQKALQAFSVRSGAKFVYWLQDLFGLAIDAVVGRTRPLLSKAISAPFKALEHHLLRVSDEVLTISPTFSNYVASTGRPVNSIHLFPNWAPLADQDEADCPDRLADLDIPRNKRVLYSGTLGLKHNPDFLAELAMSIVQHDAHVLVISEGQGRNRLEELKLRNEIDNLFLLDFQPFEAVPTILASADVLVALLTRDASAFSVPSKILSYVSVGRPVVALMPTDNQAAHVVKDASAGFVFDPAQKVQAIQQIHSLLCDPEEAERLGKAARSYAEAEFEITEIADKFEAICVSPQEIDLNHLAREPFEAQL